MKNKLLIRTYHLNDQKALVELVRLNTPQYFAPEEAHDFVVYLNNEIEDYFVVEVDQKIVASGGCNYFENKTTACISWDMVHPNYQGQGIGKELTTFRINHLKKQNNIGLVVVRTAQFTFQFYEKLGFELEKIEKDYWSKGYDLYLMKMQL